MPSVYYLIDSQAGASFLAFVIVIIDVIIRKFELDRIKGDELESGTAFIARYDVAFRSVRIDVHIGIAFGTCSGRHREILLNLNIELLNKSRSLFDVITRPNRSGGRVRDFDHSSAEQLITGLLESSLRHFPAHQQYVDRGTV
jgi:hypothetical protein